MEHVGPLDSVVQAFLFTLFSGLTAILQAITAPTYQDLLVPELSRSSLYPPFPGGSAVVLRRPDRILGLPRGPPRGPGDRRRRGRPRAPLPRPLVPRAGDRPPRSALPRLVVYVVLANVTVPVAGRDPRPRGFRLPDDRRVRRWRVAELAEPHGPGRRSPSAGTTGRSRSSSPSCSSRSSSCSIVAVALRDALLAFLIVVFPALTLVGAIPPLRPLARRAWLLFGEAAFLPCLLVIPLELAVGSASILLVVAYLTLALASPALISVAGTQLTQLGFPGASGVLAGASSGVCRSPRSRSRATRARSRN